MSFRDGARGRGEGERRERGSIAADTRRDDDFWGFVKPSRRRRSTTHDVDRVDRSQT